MIAAGMNPIAEALGIVLSRLPRGYDVMVACQLPKLIARVQFPLPAPPYRICSLSDLIEPANPVLERCRSAHITLDDLRNRLFIPGKSLGYFPFGQASDVELGCSRSSKVVEVEIHTFGATLHFLPLRLTMSVRPASKDAPSCW